MRGWLRVKKSFAERNPVTIAVVGILGLVVVLALALNFQRLPLVGGGDTFRAEFADASGLQVGEEVRVAGIKVGQVTGIELDGAKVIVELTVKDVDLGDETTAGIEVKTLLGQHYLSLSPSGSGSLDEGDTIPLARTSTPLNVVPAFQRLSDQAARIDTAQVTKAFDTLAELLDTTAPEVKGTLSGLARLSHSLSSRDDQIERLFARANRVTGTVADRDQEIGELLTASDQVLRVLESRRDVIRRVITGTRDLSQQLSGLVADNRKALGPALRHLNTVLDVLRARDHELRDILKYARLYAREFSNVAGTGHWFDATIKAPRNIAVCSVGGTAGLPALLDPLLSRINETVNGTSTPCLPFGPATGGS